VRAPILLIGGLILSFILDWRLALVLAATVPFVIIAIVIITKKSVPCYFDIQRSSDNMVRSMQENISGIRVVKALSKGEHEEKKFHSISEDLAERELKANKIMSLTNPLATLILNMGLVVVIVAGAYLSANSGTILAFLSYFTIILNAMLGLSKIFVVLSRGVASAERIEQVLDLDTTQELIQSAEGDGDYAVQFDNVQFSYNGVENNLTDINFALKHGQTLGIIGATGSGKSTIINLLLRFYDADGGTVYVDGRDVRSYPAGELHAKVGVAFQNDFLMATSVADNVDFGRNLPSERITAAIEGAQAKEFVDGLDGGTDFCLAQKAANLSGGQKQRLIVARALAAKPEILILDDSSSALDYATDAKLRRELKENYSSAAKIIVAQRVSSIINADCILVMDEGRVIGSGSHSCLMKTCEEYRNIYAAQMGDGEGLSGAQKGANAAGSAGGEV
jgi:ATP-binding cassette subfamily B protein